MEDPPLCNSCHCPLFHFSGPLEENVPIKTRYLRARFQVVQCITPWLVPLVRTKKPSRTKKGNKALQASKLEPGDLVEVRSWEEIERTLDRKGKNKGLKFMPEQKRFCGQRFKVFRKVNKIMLEATGEMRTIATPTYFLEQAYCDGEYHSGCERSCFCMWREDWLVKAPPE